MLSTTVASPCQTLRELQARETHTDNPAYQLISGMAHAQFAEGLHFSAFHSISTKSKALKCKPSAH